MHTINVIVPAHQGNEKFKQCLIHLLDAFTPQQIFIVIDRDTERIRNILKSHGLLQILQTPSPSGPAAARNLGANAAYGDILFFVDADVTIPSDASHQIISAFNKNNGLAAIIGSYDDTPFETDFLSQYKNLLHHYVHQNGNSEAFTFWGACGAIRRDIFLESGGFDEHYRQPSVEDIELGYRLKQAGYTIRLLKRLQVKHLKKWTLLSLIKTDFFNRALPWTELILKSGNTKNDLNLKIGDRVSVACVYLLIISIVLMLYKLIFLFPVIILIAVILKLNSGLYLFFWHQSGFVFLLKCIPWHWFYFFYSGLAFMVGWVKFSLQKLLAT